MTSMEGPAVFAIVLAAGRSRRFGRNKLLECIDGRPLVFRACALARSVCAGRTVLVVGHEATAVTAAAGDMAGFVVCNEDHAIGMGTSIAAAVRAISSVADGVLILLADQPRISTDHLQALVDSWDGTDDAIVATAFSNTAGPPVLLPRATFADLGKLQGDSGAHALLHDDRFRLSAIAFDGAAADVDTPEDLDTFD